MKYLITESQKNNLKVLLKQLIRSKGIQIAFSSVGGKDKFFEIMDINSPMEFLHLFDDLDVVQSEEKPGWTLFRYKPNHNLIIYDRKNKTVFINYEEIWKVLGNVFNLEYSEIEELTQEWLSEVYNLRGVTPVYKLSTFIHLVG
jgi:hypothetical protein